MTAIFLVKALAEAMRKVVKDFELIAELQPMKPVTVYEQYLPTENFNVDTFYPLLIVSCNGIEYEGGDRVAVMQISVGVFGGYEDDGWRDLFNISERIMDFLYVTPILAGRYPMRAYPVFEPEVEQPRPFYYGYITLKYDLAAPRIGVDDLVTQTAW